MKFRLATVAFILIQSIVSGAQAEKVEYYAVIMEGAKVGYALHSRSVENGQVKTTETTDVTIGRFGTPVSIKTIETCVETTKGEPISFSAEQDMGIMATKTEGVVGRDGIAKVKTTGAGNMQENSFPWPKGAVMAERLRIISMEKGLKEGTSYDVNVFSPSMMTAIRTQVRVGVKEEVDLFGRVVMLTKAETMMSMPGMGEMTIVSYVDDDFEALKAILPMMDMKLELISCEKEFALGGNEIFDIADKMFVNSPEPIENIGSAKKVGYYLKPVEGAGNFTIPASDNQRVERLENGDVIVVVEPVSAPKGAKFPYKGTDKEIIEATKANRFLQSDDAKVIELAKRAVGDTKDAGEAAKKIEAFVADYVDDMSLSVGYASASEVAVSRKGDCSEFSVLTAAMCRAVGIPSRVVTGLAYVDDFMGKAGFGGHAWVEAYIGDKWVGLDATFKAGGRSGFDAGHIALAIGNGEPADFFGMATTLGRFKIEKVMVEGSK
ncbi:MAG: transglutaminase-like domain-containing protein [Planctomycetota bacterium]